MSFFVDGLICLVLVAVLIGVVLIQRKQRLLIDTLIAMLLVAVLASLLLYQRNNQRLDDKYERVQQALAELRDQVAYHGALKVDQSPAARYPQAISPLWFKTGVPMNGAVPGWHLWMDVAPAGDLDNDPPDPFIKHARQAGMWYNPNTGAVRARVEDQGTDLANVQLYNHLNGTELASLPKSYDAARQPVSLMSALFAPADSNSSDQEAASEVQQAEAPDEQVSVIRTNDVR